jgi:alpha/beta superfamily hydrolase
VVAGGKATEAGKTSPTKKKREGEGLSRVHITFPCADIKLEGVWHFPEETGPFPAVIVCHPHPLYGGNMSSNVVFGICQALTQQSIAALRFNFRGVGKSGGEFGEGIAEQEDVKAALAFALSTPNIDHKKIGLAGYSFGTMVATPVAVQDERVKLLALVSPALTDSGWEQLKKYNKPKLFILGDNDFVIPEPQFWEKVKDIPEPKQCQIVAGADHFWAGFEAEVAQRVAKFFAEGFG